jgi:hypothetical protein
MCNTDFIFNFFLSAEGRQRYQEDVLQFSIWVSQHNSEVIDETYSQKVLSQNK